MHKTLAIGIVTLFLCISVYFPVKAEEPLPGSVGNAIVEDPSFAFPTEATTTYNPESPVEGVNEFYKAKIKSITKEHEEPGYLPGERLWIQELSVEILEGEDTGKIVTLINEIPLNQKNIKSLSEDTQLVLGKAVIAGESEYYISDIYRLNALWIVLILFIGITLLLTKFQGIRAFLGLALSFFVIIWYIVPHIINGGNPLLISLIGTTVIAALSLYIAHGFHKRTTIALGGTLISIVLSLIFSYAFVKLTHLFGMGSEDAFYLQSIPGSSINLQGLLLGGIIIGVLGILDDITTAQAAVVEQIHEANPKLSAQELYKRGSAVGREHILSLVNTLVLAYTGASLPLILLFKMYERPVWVTLNSEIIMEEIVRMLIGSITLILAVPITTFIAARYYSKNKTGISTQNSKDHGHVH